MHHAIGRESGTRTGPGARSTLQAKRLNTRSILTVLIVAPGVMACGAGPGSRPSATITCSMDAKTFAEAATSAGGESAQLVPNIITPHPIGTLFDATSHSKLLVLNPSGFETDESESRNLKVSTSVALTFKFSAGVSEKLQAELRDAIGSTATFEVKGWRVTTMRHSPSPWLTNLRTGLRQDTPKDSRVAARDEILVAQRGYSAESIGLVRADSGLLAARVSVISLASGAIEVANQCSSSLEGSGKNLYLGLTRPKWDSGTGTFVEQ